MMMVNLYLDSLKKFMRRMEEHGEITRRRVIGE